MSPLFRRPAPLARRPLASVRTAPVVGTGTRTHPWTTTSPTEASPGADAATGDRGVETTDVCVVGLGVAGLTAATELAHAGASVIAVAAGRHGDGADAAGLGLLRPGFARPYHVVAASIGRRRARTLYGATVDELRALRDRGVAGLAWTDLVRGMTPDEAHREDVALRRDGFSADVITDGVRLAGAGMCDPVERYVRLAASARDAGVRVRSDVRALHIGDRGTHHGEIRCRTIVIAVDGGLEGAVPALAGDVATVALPLAAAAGHLTSPGFDEVVGWRPLGADQVVGGALGTTSGRDELDEQVADRFGATITHRWHVASGFTADRLPRVLRLGSTVAVGAANGVGEIWSTVLGRTAAALALDRRAPLADILAG